MISNYIKGILYGDGYYQEDENIYFFSTTHKEVSDKVRELLDLNDLKSSQYQRDNYNYKNWELLEITEIKDQNFIDYLKEVGVISNDPYIRMQKDVDFIRGYLETKGSLFSFYDKENEAWRCSFSGSEEDLVVLKEILNGWGIETHEIVRRTERESIGIISNSYRLSFQNRNGIATFVENIYGNGNVDITIFLREKIEAFLHFHRTTPFNRKKKIFKHYKYATAYMARELDIVVKGIKGGGPKNYKPVYLWENGEKIIEFQGWKGAYLSISEMYERDTGFKAPIVDE